MDAILKPSANEPPEAAARDDVRQHLRRATAALRAWAEFQPQHAERLGRVNALLREVMTDLDQVQDP